jgi:molecular chaperone DnaJ
MVWVRMEKPKDYYLLLGVARDASSSAIKRAYRRLAKRYHPDVGASSSSEDFHELQVAYETLADAERRRRYDESLRGQPERDSFAPLSWSFLRSPAAGDLRRPVRPGSLSGEILLTSDEAQIGGILPLDVPVPTVCRACEGTGGAFFDCGHCGGEGKVERRLPVPLRIPAGIRDGTLFQVAVDDPEVMSLVLTVHIRPL